MAENTNDTSRRSFIANITKGVVGASMIPSVITAKDRQKILETLQDQISIILPMIKFKLL
jgi:hypothetical protein